MNLHQIKYFLAVVDSGTFSKAAARVYVTQPTLSAGIKTLEEELGKALFIRNNRRVVMTDSGKRFLPHARAAYKELEAGRRKLENNHECTIFRLGLLNTVPIEPIARVIRDYRSIYPTAIVEVHEGTDSLLRTQLASGDIDALVTTLFGTDKSESSLPLFEEQVMLAVSVSHPIAVSKSSKLLDLHDLPFIDRVDCELWGELQSSLKRQHIEPRVVYRARSDEVVIELVAAGLGVSILPRRMHRHHNIKFIPIEDFSRNRIIGLKWNSHNQPAHVDEFRRFTESHVW